MISTIQYQYSQLLPHCRACFVVNFSTGVSGYGKEAVVTSADIPRVYFSLAVCGTARPVRNRLAASAGHATIR